MAATEGLNASHQRRLLANAQHADRLVSEILEILNATGSGSLFPPYRPDVSPHQARLIRSHLTRFRSHFGRVLTAVGVPLETNRAGALHSIRVALTFIRIAIEEMAPERLRGYGELSPTVAQELRGLSAELEGLIQSLEHSLSRTGAEDLQDRLARLEATADEAALLRRLDQIVNTYQLAEFSAPLLRLVEKLELPVFEIAVFGRVSCGKSSLLNRLLGAEVLPVGVNPITAVPTRLVFAPEPLLTVTTANHEVQQLPLSHLARFASEEENPANEAGVTRLVVGLPSPLLREGLVLVDTPGLGALAGAGAAETLTYLPQCDYAMVLISAATPLNDEDLDTLQALAQAGIPAMVLLSKADLLSPAEREKAKLYTRKQIEAHLGLRVDVHPVSALPREAQLLQQWSETHLSPLLARHKELAAGSLRRKTGALRESVLAALLALRDAASAPAAAASGEREKVERALRAAAGEMEQARRFCLNASDDVRRLAPIALRRSVAALLSHGKDGGSRLPSSTAAIRAAAEVVAAEAASSVSSRLIALAQQLEDALLLAAKTLYDDNHTREPLAALIREMPRFEMALPDGSWEPSRLCFWQGFRKLCAARWVERAAAASLEAAFTQYGRGLEAWVRKVLGDLQLAFDSRADVYRAQFARLAARPVLPAEERKRLQQDVLALQDFAPGHTAPQVAPAMNS